MEVTAQQRDVRAKQAANAPKHPTAWIIAASILILIGGTLFLYSRVSWQQALLYVLGAFGGFVLYQAHFGFTSAWRKFILYRQGEGIRAQMVMMAATLAGRYTKPVQWKRPTRMTIGALIGGLMMGYGARLAFGCNIGAYFGGIASFSAHGWAWFVFAFLGSLIGVKLRPYCAYKN
ncbi:YeeE/YedE family protein [Geobacillus stearothermophilus]|uniref:YeeE/YedE thiosulfate transporter family protein n=1 Tax=Geobacillus stearothermophilus TaxID=1422 RepID=UPI001F1EDCA5|nr:YeeE/YedE family protein [Geobacillus stearothermophilus]